MHLADGNKHNVYSRPEPKKVAAFRCMGVNLIRHKVEEHMPSWRGDIVTYIQVINFVIAKAAGLKLVKANKTFREQAEVSRSMKSSKHQVITADEKVMTIVLKGKQSDHIDTMRYQRFLELVTTGKRPSTPTCCHQSVLQRNTTASKSSIRSKARRNNLQAGDWGWELCGGGVKPMKLWPCPSIIY